MRGKPPPRDKTSAERAMQEASDKFVAAGEKAVKMITELNKDPASKARKLASFAKLARAKFVA